LPYGKKVGIMDNRIQSQESETKLVVAVALPTTLPEGCSIHAKGLILRPGLSVEEWRSVGRGLTKAAGSLPWLLGDWLAYGQENEAYCGERGRLKNGIYAEIAAKTDYHEGRLRNMKCVCSRLPLSRRRDNLSFTHAEEIVVRSSPARFDYWINRVCTERLPAKKLRAELIKAKAIYSEEPNDGGKVTLLATTDQYVRDLMAAVNDMTPAQAREHLENLKPLFTRLNAKGNGATDEKTRGTDGRGFRN
jgi:hypothetical protein